MCDSGFDSGCDSGFDSGLDTGFDSGETSEGSFDVEFDGTDTSELDSLEYDDSMETSESSLLEDASFNIESGPELLDNTVGIETGGEYCPPQSGNFDEWQDAMEDVPSFEEHMDEINNNEISEMEDVPIESADNSTSELTTDTLQLDDVPAEIETEESEILEDIPTDVTDNESIEMEENITYDIPHEEISDSNVSSELSDNDELANSNSDIENMVENQEEDVLEEIEFSNNDITDTDSNVEYLEDVPDEVGDDTANSLQQDNQDVSINDDTEIIETQNELSDIDEHLETSNETNEESQNESEFEEYHIPYEPQNEEFEEYQIPVTDVQTDVISENSESNQTVEQIADELQEEQIDYESIYDSINNEALGQGFENINIDEDTDRLNSSLESFENSNWESMSLEDQKSSMQNLAEYVENVIGFDNPPSIEYYNNPQEGDYGGFDPKTNTLNVNEYMLYNSNEAPDTIAHELWHAHQYECANNPQSALDYQYQYNFNNYISPDLGQEAYESQLVEAEARAFASQFKDRLSELSGR